MDSQHFQSDSLATGRKKGAMQRLSSQQYFGHLHMAKEKNNFNTEGVKIKRKTYVGYMRSKKNAISKHKYTDRF